MTRRGRLLGFVGATVLVAATAVAVAETAMDMSPADRRLLYGLFGAMAAVTASMAVVSLRWAPRLASLAVSLRLVALAAVVVAGGVVAAAALTMFIEPHDLTLVLVALLLGVGLGSVLALAVAGSLTADLGRLAVTAEAVGNGELEAETGIDRRDELGAAARAFDSMTRRLAEAERRQRVAEEERRRVIAGLGHDLRTPLASLQASLEALSDGVAADPGRYWRGMGADVDHLRRLVEDLFLLSRLEAGSHRIQPELIDLGEIADEAVEAMLPLSSARGVGLAARPAPGAAPVTADPAAVGRILRNLVDNALRHAPPGSEVEVITEVDRAEVRTTVVDAGPGFPREGYSMSFERGSGEAAAVISRPHGGTGLGLAIARELAGLSGGRLEILPGRGGRVALRLPRA